MKWKLCWVSGRLKAYIPHAFSVKAPVKPTYTFGRPHAVFALPAAAAQILPDIDYSLPSTVEC